MAGLRLEHIYKRYTDSVAVNDVNFDIHDKEFLVLVGPSGCGKSTTLRMIAGLEEISEGNIYIGDRVVNDVPPKDRDIAMVFQSYALYPHMSVYDNLAFVRAVKGFVVQAGSPDQSNSTSNTGPGYTVQAETPTTQPAQKYYPVGTLAFAKSGSEPAGRADSPFFLVTGPQGASLSPDYAVIGHVTVGLAVAKKIETLAPPSGDGPPTKTVVIKKLRISSGAATTPTS